MDGWGEGGKRERRERRRGRERVRRLRSLDFRDRAEMRGEEDVREIQLLLLACIPPNHQKRNGRKEGGRKMSSLSLSSSRSFLARLPLHHLSRSTHQRKPNLSMKEEAEEVSVDTRYRARERERGREGKLTFPSSLGMLLQPVRHPTQLISSPAALPLYTLVRGRVNSRWRTCILYGEKKEKKREEGRREVAVGEVNERELSG